MRRVLIILGIILIPIIPVILVVTGVISKKPTTVAPASLTVWSTDYPEKSFDGIIERYRATHTYVTITVKQVPAEDYLQQLLQAWAQGTGPDVFFVPNTWIGQMSAYGVAMPADLGVPIVKNTKGLFGVSRQVIIQPAKAPSIDAFKNAFVDAVGADIVRENQVWALPLSMDTLVTYYNKDLLNNAKIFEPAKTWPELASQVEANHLTVTDTQGNLVRSAVGLGTSNNVPYASDLLALLMMQNGAQMVDANGQASFNQAPGLTAVNFYTSFARSNKVTYSWDANQSNAKDAFLQGKVAYYFGTLADREAIAASSLNWGVSPMLHLTAEGDNDADSQSQRLIDVARYPVGMISKTAETAGHAKLAWNFLQFASQSSNVPVFLNALHGLSAQRSILATQKNDATFSVYAGQLLTAKTWYHGTGGQTVDGYLSGLITSVASGKTDPQEALDLAVKQVNSTL